MKHSVFDNFPADAPTTPEKPAGTRVVAPDVPKNPTYQSFLGKATALGTEDTLQEKSAKRAQLLKILRPIDHLTRTGAWVRAGWLALGWSPLICATPFIYSRFGLDAILFDSLLPASLVTALLFWAVKTLQKSPWAPILPGTESALELERAVAQLDETRQLRDALLHSRKTLYVADLKLLIAYTRQRQAEGVALSGV